MRHINSLFQQSELPIIDAHQKQVEVAQRIWLAIAPGNLIKFSHASGIKNQQLTIYSDNNAVAAKIKLLMPGLLANLKAQASTIAKQQIVSGNQTLEVTLIRVKVQVKSSQPITSKTIKKLSPQAAKNLDQLAKKLPGTPLGDALMRLAKRAF